MSSIRRARAVVWLGPALASLLLFWILLCRLYSVPVLPVDETRYLSVTWEMWQSGQWWLPLINDQPYSHKPPYPANSRFLSGAIAEALERADPESLHRACLPDAKPGR